MKHISKDMMLEIHGVDSFRRVNEIHPLDLYIGRDVSARPTLLLISDMEPSPIFSSKLIGIRIGKRADSRWALTFSLTDSHLEDIFYHFCDDIIESSSNVPNQNAGTLFICDRYIKWQELLKKSVNGLMSFSEIKGLMGELLFLKNVLFDKYGIKPALLSWIGPQKADQDFVCVDSWYEVKTTVSGAETIHISSIEQLDTSISGELVVVYLDKTSYSDAQKITLNSLVSEIFGMLPHPDERRIFGDILMEQGYIPKDEYNEYLFKYNGHARYEVAIDFPSLKRALVPNAVTNANYQLSLAGLAKFLKEE